jgi:hypothetical protein
MPKTSTGLIVPLNAVRDEAVEQGPPRAPFVKQINAELKKLDPYLELVWIGPNAARGVIPGVEPGRWHIRRTPPGIIHSYWPIMGPDKEYVDPSMKIIEDMKAADLWREGALQELRDRQVREAEKKAKAAELEREQNVDVASMDIRAGKRVFGDGGLKKRRMFKK